VSCAFADCSKATVPTGGGTTGAVVDPSDGEGDGEMDMLAVHDSDGDTDGVGEGEGRVTLRKDQMEALVEVGVGVITQSTVLPLKLQPPVPDMAVPAATKYPLKEPKDRDLKVNREG
jgi:hypothetical protein